MCWLKAGVFSLWFCIVVLGIWEMAVYKSTPGRTGKDHTTWPVDSRIQREVKRSSLVLFLHPKCPCSRATLGELERLLPVLKNRTQVYIEFVLPEGKSEIWGQDTLWERATALARIVGGIGVRFDKSGREADLFGAQTSGHVFLYDVLGNLKYSGGITSDRGHMGDSAGRIAILAWIGGQTSRQVARADAFGCSLKEEH